VKPTLVLHPPEDMSLAHNAHCKQPQQQAASTSRDQGKGLNMHVNDFSNV